MWTKRQAKGIEVRVHIYPDYCKTFTIKRTKVDPKTWFIFGLDPHYCVASPSYSVAYKLKGSVLRRLFFLKNSTDSFSECHEVLTVGLVKGTC